VGEIAFDEKKRRALFVRRARVTSLAHASGFFFVKVIHLDCVHRCVEVRSVSWTLFPFPRPCQGSGAERKKIN